MVIAGGGIAAAAAAIRLRAIGLRVVLLVRDVAPVPGIEAIPMPALALFDVLGEAGVAAEAGAVEVHGPMHQWHAETGRVPGSFLHVDRTALATTLLSRAVARGASVERVTRLIRPDDVSADAVVLIDGTGRASAWSRPVWAEGHAMAWQFRAPPDDDMSGRVVREGGWWAYRLGHAGATWLGVVTATCRLPASVLDAAARRLALAPASLVPQGRRPAGLQGAVHPVSGRRIAVGDAALAHDPVAGQGIRFALGSAIAAATTVATLVDDETQRDVAADYYRGLIEAELSTHRAMLDRLFDAGPAGHPTVSSGSPAMVRLGAPIVQVPLSIDGRVELGPALRLADGTTTRWVGNFDLLQLAELTTEPTPRVLLVARLQALGLDVRAARELVAWAVSKGVLADATRRPWLPSPG